MTSGDPDDGPVGPVAVSGSVDVRHVACPPALWVLIAMVRKGSPGEVFEVLTTDSADKDDVAKWAMKSGNEVVSVIKEEGYERILLRKLR